MLASTMRFDLTWAIHPTEREKNKMDDLELTASQRMPGEKRWKKKRQQAQAQRLRRIRRERTLNPGSRRSNNTSVDEEGEETDKQKAEALRIIFLLVGFLSFLVSHDSQCARNADCRGSGRV